MGKQPHPVRPLPTDPYVSVRLKELHQRWRHSSHLNCILQGSFPRSMRIPEGRDAVTSRWRWSPHPGGSRTMQCGPTILYLYFDNQVKKQESQKSLLPRSSESLSTFQMFLKSADSTSSLFYLLTSTSGSPLRTCLHHCKPPRSGQPPAPAVSMTMAISWPSSPHCPFHPAPNGTSLLPHL